MLLENRAAGLGFHVLLAVLLLSACGQPGNEAAAAAAADDFIEHLVAGQADEAWQALTPPTRAQTYDDDADAFAADVASADWSSMRWRIGPVSNHDISWGVYVEVTGGDVPAFLTEREIAGEWTDGMHLLVQIHDDESYAVAGRSMDEAPAGRGHQPLANYPSLGDRFVAAWATDATLFDVYDLATGRTVEVMQFPANPR